MEASARARPLNGPGPLASASPVALNGSTRSASPSSARPNAGVLAPSSPSKNAKRFTSLASRTKLGVEELERQQNELVALAQSRARTNGLVGQSGSAAGSLHPWARVSGAAERQAPQASSFLQKAQEVQQALAERQTREAEAQRRRQEAVQRENARSRGFADRTIPIPSSSAAGPHSSQTQSSAFVRSVADRRDKVAEPDEDPGESKDYYIDVPGAKDGQTERAEDFTLVESLAPGPRRLPPPKPSDPEWTTFEPYSGHRLRERKLPHAELTEHLRGRYHIPPSLLYSVAREIEPETSRWARRDRAMDGDFEVPVTGDWIVIATIVEKSGLLMTKPGNSDAATKNASSGSPGVTAAPAVADEDDPVVFQETNTTSDGRLKLHLEPGDDESGGPGAGRSNKRQQEADERWARQKEQARIKSRPRKFVVMKLLDLGAPAGVGEGSSGRGSNFLELSAFEADRQVGEHSSRADVRPEVAALLPESGSTWVNGSRGAFELLYHQAPGTIVAILNPKIRRSRSKLLQLTPRSAEDCLIIGMALDYQQCSATKANGARCPNAVDVKARKQTRVSVCDFHLGMQMDSVGKSRPEFSANATTKIGTGPGGMGTASFSSGGGPGAGGFKSSSKSRSSAKRLSKYMKNFRPEQSQLARTINSNYGQVGDGMESNGGQVFVSESPLDRAGPEVGMPIKASDPSSWKYDVSERYGRGAASKEQRLQTQIKDRILQEELEQRFGPTPTMMASSMKKLGVCSAELGMDRSKGHKEKLAALPVLPNGSADLINAAYSTLDERKRKADQTRSSVEARRRKLTGIVPATNDTAEGGDRGSQERLRFMTSSKSSSVSSGASTASSTPGSASSTRFQPLPGLGPMSSASRKDSTGSQARSTLLQLATGQTRRDPAHEPVNLRVSKTHRPKLRIPESDRVYQVAGERIHVDQLDDWESDLLELPSATVPHPSCGDNLSLSQKLANLSKPPLSSLPVNNDDDDSDLEIV
ncbi:hypothetical protein BCV70DRAFT_230708 [Testicularia cyperi]|uniref:Uncharacterized protein n=1 Tax=Testicularia cyperi TaxID=1882483 RepID=A0A317XT48_9BASI|nr:hypothetical protein BCV70DRAFT_230708 [Testicularia cyperi]